jgi:hypothetical protein
MRKAIITRTHIITLTLTAYLIMWACAIWEALP